MKSQNLPDIAAMRMTYLMYYVACIYVRDSTVVMDTCACGDNGMRRYTTYTAVLNLILLISRDAIHMVVCRYTHRSVVLLQADDWNQLVYAGSIVVLRMTPRVIYPAGINTQPPRVPRLAITLSSSESATRSSSSLI